MNQISSERLTVEIEGNFVVFLIGMRINKPWRVHQWWPVAMATPRSKEFARDRLADKLGGQAVEPGTCPSRHCLIRFRTRTSAIGQFRPFERPACSLPRITHDPVDPIYRAATALARAG